MAILSDRSSMKKLVIVGILVLMGIAIHAQGIRIENDTDVPIFWLSIDETQMGDPALMTMERYRTLVHNGASSFFYLAPRTSKTDLPLGAEPRYLLILSQDGTRLVPSYLRLPKGTAINPGTPAWVSLGQARPLVLSDSSDSLYLPDIGRSLGDQRVDGTFAEWIGKTPAVLGAPGLLKRVVQSKEGLEASIRRADALTNNKAGTDIDRLAFSSTDQGWFGMYAAKSGIASGLSLVLRFPMAENGLRYTLEVPIWDRGGQVLIWTEGVAKPLDCGMFTFTGVFLEFELDKNKIPLELQNLLSKKIGEVGFATVWQDGSMAEEWDYGTIPIANLSYLPLPPR